MTKQCECPQRRWALPTFVANLIRLAFAIWVWIILHGAMPAAVFQVAVNILHLALTIVIATWGVFL